MQNVSLLSNTAENNDLFFKVTVGLFFALESYKLILFDGKV